MQKNTIFFSFVLGLLFSLKSFSQVQVTKIYWANDSSIQSSNPDGSNVQTVLDYRAVDVAIDNDANKMYYNGNGSDIFRANLDGTNVETVISGATANGFALDLANEKVYWTEFSNNRLRRADLDGTNMEDIVINTQNPSGLGLDLTNGKVYWGMYNSGTIRRANLDGTNQEDVITSGLLQPWTVKVDEVNSKIYYTDRSTLRRANLDGSSSESLSTSGVPQGLSLDVTGGKVYWAGSGIRSINIDGTGDEELITSGESGGVWGLAFETGVVDATAPVFSAVSPSSDSTVSSADVGYTLSEALASGTVTFTRTGGTADASSPHVVNLEGTELEEGTRAVAALTNTPTLVNGAIYTISFDGQDVAENMATTVNSMAVTFDDSTLSLEARVANQISIYPNPVSKQLFISASSVDIVGWSLIDMQGKTLKHGGLDQHGIDMSSINSGMYVLRLQTNKDTFYKRIVKQ